ncbi:hypothetical protein AC249_AIPGENE11458 [Exaiptasia diaphana]|nr:hypothetical protein AC249_AIPGENE11458 [Exaiptasia diaphana]
MQARDKGASSWLHALPIKELGFALNKQEFRDSLRLRYNQPLVALPSHCTCGSTFSVNHALSCKKGGFVSERHDGVLNLLAPLLNKVCNNVEVQPRLIPLDNEHFVLQSTNTSQEARLDLKAGGFWSKGVTAFFDVGITHVNSNTNKNKNTATIFREHENEKKRKYEKRVINVNRVFLNGSKVCTPKPKTLKRGKAAYLKWLRVVAESLNSAHYPKAPAKWYHMDFPHVPEEYLCHLQKKMCICGPNTVKETRHVKFPVWTENTLKISYKTLNKVNFRAAMEEQSEVPIYFVMAFRGVTEVDPEATSHLRGRDALEAAKEGLVSTVPTKRSEIKIEEGEGRATRECELTSYGKLTIRIYIAKVDI